MGKGGMEVQLPINFNLEDFRKREKIQQIIEKKAKRITSRNKKERKKGSPLSTDSQ